MFKRKTRLSILSLFIIFAVFILAGCDKKNEEKNQIQNQSQNQEQGQEKKQNQAAESKNESGAGVENRKKAGGPSAEMTKSCSGKTDGDSCEISMPSREAEGEVENIKGTCRKMRDGETLSCFSDIMSQGRQNRGQAPGQQ